MLKRLDLKYICIFVGLCTAAFVSYVFQTRILYGIKCFFEFPELNLCFGALSAIVTILHKAKTRNFIFSETMSFNEFKIPVENLLSFVSNPITIVCSLALAKGIYFQIVEGIPNFPFFNGIELTFVAIVTAYLLFISVFELGKHFAEIFTKPALKVAVPEAISEEQYIESKGENTNRSKE